MIWYDDREEKQLELRHVLKIIPGQRTVSFCYNTTYPMLVQSVQLRARLDKLRNMAYDLKSLKVRSGK